MVAVPMVTVSGEQHGLINVLTNAVPFDDFKNMTGPLTKKIGSGKEERMPALSKLST